MSLGQSALVLEVEKISVRKNTLEDGLVPEWSGPSGPKKMTIGCVIWTVPRRNNVSQAVRPETPSANKEMAVASGSIIHSRYP